MLDLKKIEAYAEKCYADANCVYGEDKGTYMIHIRMVIDFITAHNAVFKNHRDFVQTVGAASCHDLIEDAKQTYNNISDVAGKDVADITLGVTDVPAENRLMKHLLTMGKTVRDYRAIILKLADIYANTSYSKKEGTSMYKKYVEEYPYRKAIFKKALSWYKDDVNHFELIEIWKELDEINTI
jgi:(p)ppGpp synthase/HD superfamily hydrolase